MDRVCMDHSPVIITRNRDQAVVMLSLDDYEALEETGWVPYGNLPRLGAGSGGVAALNRRLQPMVPSGNLCD
jgi:hypothetical protein